MMAAVTRTYATTLALVIALGALAAGGCDDGDGELDAGPADAGPPEELDAGFDGGAPIPDAGPGCEGPPGLYEPGDCTVVALGVRAYRPRFELWADGAEKERYIYLPPGETIDATDPDNWVFPVGTRLYKTFYVGGVRIETRVLEKTDPGTGLTAWDMRTYAWLEDQTGVEDVTNAPPDRRENALGTEHDIPSGSDCVQCHNGTLDLVNGFSAIMLNHDGDGVTLADLLAPPATLAPAFAQSLADVPGTPAEQATLGYLHANCGHCHHPPIPARGPSCGTPACNSGFLTWLDTGLATVDATALFDTGVNRVATTPRPGSNAWCRIHPGAPDTSLAVVRMEARGGTTGLAMPPLATDQVHAAGVAMLRDLVGGLTVPANPACAP